MKHYLTAQRLVLLLALVACSICFFSFRKSFRKSDNTQQKTFRKESFRGDDDTSTRRKRNRGEDEYRIRSLDAAMKNLDDAMLRLDEEMNKMDFYKMEKEIKAAKINRDKIQKEAEASIAKIDWKKMQADIERSSEKIKEIDMEKIKEEMKKVKANLEKQNFDIKIDANKIKNEARKSIEKAKESIEKVKVEIQQMKEFTNALEKDGLIDKSKPYKIQVKDGELFINDKKQSKEVNDQYKKYYRKENFTINSDANYNEGVLI